MNVNIQGRRSELANFSYDIRTDIARRYNVVANVISRAYCNASFAPTP